MMDIAGTHLSDKEREQLRHPFVGGVILFSRNFSSVEQLCNLTREIRSLRTPSLIIAVDHEGGRVQRFQTDFTRLPAAAQLGLSYQKDPIHACSIAFTIGWLIGVELQTVGVDFSFTPVLDIDHGQCEVIGNRALHTDPEIVACLAHHIFMGLEKAGMGAVGKHFPGHGWVLGDSHHVLPEDTRPFDVIEHLDIYPFRYLVDKGLAAIMPAHVVYTAMDSLPACFSHYWLTDVLRHNLGFNGAIISDDLGMAGALCMGSAIDRVNYALDAGCDMVLLCNDKQAIAQVLQYITPRFDETSTKRLHALRARNLYAQNWQTLTTSTAWKQAREILATLPIHAKC